MSNHPPTPATNQTSGSKDERKEVIIQVNYEIFILGLTVIQLINSILIFTVDEVSARMLVRGFFIAIALVLLIDLVVRAFRLRGVLSWYRQGYFWLNVVGTIPVPFFVGARIVRVWLVTRKMSASDVDDAQDVIVRQRAGGLLLLALLAATAVLEFGGLMMLYYESASPEANIRTASDAVWWGLVTVATVGYGDKYPVTNPGRVVGVLVMIVGVGLFSLLTSYLAQNFIDDEDEVSKPLQKVPGEAENELEAIRRLLDEYEGHHQAAMGELRARLEMLEGQQAAVPAAMPKDGGG